MGLGVGLAPVAHERDHGRLQRAQVGLEDLLRVRAGVRDRVSVGLGLG